MTKMRNTTILVLLAILTAIYIYICVCVEGGNERRYESFENENNMSVDEVVVMDSIFPGRAHPISLVETAETKIHYNNIDKEITFRFGIFNAPPVLSNVLIIFSDIRQQKPDIKWSTSKWLAHKSGDDKIRYYIMSKYLEPNTVYRIAIKVNSSKNKNITSILLRGDGLNSPVHIGSQHFRALGIETVMVDNNTNTEYGGELDGNMGLALIVPSSLRPGQELQEETIPGGVISLGQVQMMSYNQLTLSIRIPDIRIYKKIIEQRNSNILASTTEIKDTYSEANIDVLGGISAYVPWKLDATVKQLTNDGSRKLIEEEVQATSKDIPPPRLEASNPSICVTSSKPNGPCEIRVIGIYPGMHYEVKVEVVFNNMNSINNYRRTHPLTIKFQAIDLTGSASLLSPTQSEGLPRGIAETINAIGVDTDIFNNRQMEQNSKLDGLDKMYNGITFA